MGGGGAAERALHKAGAALARARSRPHLLFGGGHERVDLAPRLPGVQLVDGALQRGGRGVDRGGDCGGA